MNNWKVGTRIAAAFAAVMLLTTAVGFYSYMKVGEIDATAKRVTGKSLPKVFLVGEIEKNVQLVYSLALQTATASTPGEKSNFESQIQAVRVENAGFVGDYEKLVDTEKGRALTETFKTARSAFWNCLEDTLKTGRAGTPEANRRAMETTITELRSAQKSTRKQLKTSLSLTRSRPMKPECRLTPLSRARTPA